jgi:hypothetical protein
MLLVIFGAGASFDSVPHLRPDSRSIRPITPYDRRLPNDEYRPPLANQLFEDRDSFRSALYSFPQCKPLIPRLRGDAPIEEQLAKFEAQAKAYPARHQQLAAIRYYIRSLLAKLETAWIQRHDGVTNYVTFLDEVRRWRDETGEQVIFVTFNYDLMLEQAFWQVFHRQIAEMKDYISDDSYGIIKLHGSIDWVHEIQYPNGLKSLDAVIDAAPFLKLNPGFVKDSQIPPNIMTLPALAIPVDKKKVFECPQEHIEVLANGIQKVTKIITIGWRAMEQHFLEMLRARLTGLQSDVDLMVVSGTENGTKGTMRNLGMDEPSQFKRSLVGSGFTGLVKNIEVLESFLR